MPARAATAGPAVVRLAAVDSTQEVAFALAADGAPDGTVVVADVQRAGRGRRGRRWLAEPGTSLLASFVLRTSLPPARRPLLGFAAAVAVTEALQAVSGLAARTRWPNDVLVGGGKVAGILLEARGEADPVVLGIGINLNQTTFPPELGGRATSVRLASGRPADREAVLEALRAALAVWRARLEGEGFAPVRAAWAARSATLGQPVAVEGQVGRAVAVDDDGALVVETAGGRVRIVGGELADAPGR